MNISFTQMPGSIGHQSNWHGASGTRWGTTEGQRPGKHWGGGRAGCMLLLPPGCCSDPADGSWHWRSVCGSSLHFLSHHPSNEEEHFLRLTGAQVRCFLALSTLGIQDAGLLLPRWRWAWVSRVDVFWVFTVHSWRRRSKPVSALGLSLILLPSINRNPIV